jgi:excisionase family DNA binding protein
VPTRVEPAWITYSDAEQLVGLSRVTLWRLVKSGEVKSASIGRARRISRQSLEDYLERQASEASK